MYIQYSLINIKSLYLWPVIDHTNNFLSPFTEATLKQLPESQTLTREPLQRTVVAIVMITGLPLISCLEVLGELGVMLAVISSE